MHRDATLARVLRTYKVVLVSCALAFVGCSGDSDPTGILRDFFCTANVVPGIVVEITDENTGLFIAAEARGAVRDGTYVDSLIACEFTSNLMRSRQGAWERAGIYEVSVTHTGHEDWVLEPVRVESDECHVITVRLRAAMIPLR